VPSSLPERRRPAVPVDHTSRQTEEGHRLARIGAEEAVRIRENPCPVFIRFTTPATLPDVLVVRGFLVGPHVVVGGGRMVLRDDGRAVGAVWAQMIDTAADTLAVAAAVFGLAAQGEVVPDDCAWRLSGEERLL